MSEPLELCCDCDAATGRAGRADDSLYAGEYGPLCEECYERLVAGAARWRKDSADLQSYLRRVKRELTVELRNEHHAGFESLVSAAEILILRCEEGDQQA